MGRVRLKTPSTFADYLDLTKPGIMMAILMTTFMGFFIASRGVMDWSRLVWLLVGTALASGSAGALNHYWESDIDASMSRTADRPLPAKRLAPILALNFGVLLGLAALTVLVVFINPITAFLGGLTIALYIFIYTPMKRKSTLNTLVGAIPGALPPLAGWLAVQNLFTWEAVSIFLVFFLWQMPHFYAIAWLYREDYSKGGFIMLPNVDKTGNRLAFEVVFYAAVLVISSVWMTFETHLGWIFLAISTLMSGYFLYTSILMAIRKNQSAARRVMITSFFYLPVLLIALLGDYSISIIF
ncbi:MAG: heme o synthase [Candidatus Marinimicrobia bacterium]|nr:heme o synthase [Candidatus Neomarinimicrobiota bacterium]MCF7840382.1 heme o synthase [Candidatus Neomarinimicrobiota bacterium]MCF7901973.1 heme o synthase [Candidatus Neomarinimicrobiota bacterium]